MGIRDRPETNLEDRTAVASPRGSPDGGWTAAHGGGCRQRNVRHTAARWPHLARHHPAIAARLAWLTAAGVAASHGATIARGRWPPCATSAHGVARAHDRILLVKTIGTSPITATAGHGGGAAAQGGTRRREVGRGGGGRD
ncbi:1-deoxy-D-xylulose 5-phosphate reductoisomerase [Dorcoceras hygrometricum]|uniref:1-deoxy-D-xylulose 5-phosphate reductoisomerase n=1 Tax=Dorcoceras hygrometricum TaxID=472368 RepID=A0A2Z7B5L6_9LAMI|nr:1-deoxy-D-xylulose 5-phosphate reductoisomerase [Dorcoceras hygrometricum]